MVVTGFFAQCCMLCAHCHYDFMLVHLNLELKLTIHGTSPKWLIYRNGYLTDSQIITNEIVN